MHTWLYMLYTNGLKIEIIVVKSCIDNLLNQMSIAFIELGCSPYIFFYEILKFCLWSLVIIIKVGLFLFFTNITLPIWMVIFSTIKAARMVLEPGKSHHLVKYYLPCFLTRGFRVGIKRGGFSPFTNHRRQVNRVGLKHNQ